MAKNQKKQGSRTEKRPNRAEYEEVTENKSSGEIMLLAAGAVLIFLFLCNFGICGALGNALRFFMFGVFGLPAYIMPPLIFLACAFLYANEANRASKIKTGAGIALYTIVAMISELAAGRVQVMAKYSLPEIYMECGTLRNGGGVIAGSLAYASYKNLSMAGTVLLIIVGFIICGVLLTERSFIRGLKRGGRFVVQNTAHTVRDMRERDKVRRRVDRERRELLEEKKQLAIEKREDERLLRRDRRLSGVTTDTTLERDDEQMEVKRNTASHVESFIPGEDERDDVHLITVHRYGADYEENSKIEKKDMPVLIDEDVYSKRGNVREITRETLSDPAEVQAAGIGAEEQDNHKEADVHDKTGSADRKKPAASAVKKTEIKKPYKPYEFPPLDLLKKGNNTGSDTDEELRETAEKLVKILETFGVSARVTEVSQGPTVTRYELQPDAGVKVSKILGLIDDIKLNLAATDIRIEAPIPGKAAVGIEVPNKSVATVFFRDVVDTQDFKAFKSKLAFGVGKDLAGKPVVADIAKMPHVLIAGATGSGKSVCINTIIMSILYKASPDDVKLIMIDPKVVELSVYNGIPHLLIPVVTEPQKAAAALNWAVAEMTRRYKMFADAKVRDLAGYNAALEKLDEGERPPKMSQILVIVDELADLMMTCANDVESAIVRLTQLARAAGIHLVIATQRPSVDVITGLIKANMPSRVAFAVTSNTDSRTILDMVGAERLLGKGDMLFFPQGYTRPARVQGAFVSDDEVAEVTKFIRDQEYVPVTTQNIDEEMEGFEVSGGSSGGQTADGDERDAFFEDAARLVIGKDKASISMLQRVFKVGFNRSARIMDQLCEAGVVSEDEGTKPRKVLMTEAQFEEYLSGRAVEDENEEAV